MSADKYTDRVRKLFAKAQSTTSEHEAEALLARAYALLAKHGIDETLARSGTADASEVGTWTFTPAGPYKYDQVYLVGVVADALHCYAVKTPTGDVIIYGVKRHLDRVEMLAGMLVGYMLATAAKARPAIPSMPTVTYRKSVMAGFMAEVQTRLRAAEKRAQHESGYSTGAEVVLASDEQRAREAMHAAHGRLTYGSSPRRSSEGFAAGKSAARSVDLGGGNRVGGRAAIAG